MLILMLFSLAYFWLQTEKSSSYPEPQDALNSLDKNRLLIPAYKLNDASLSFFIDDSNILGAAFVKKGLLGWKTGIITSSPIEEIEPRKINGFQGQDEHLIYGLILNEHNHYVEVNGVRSALLDLETMLKQSSVKEYELENISLWYYQSENPIEQGEIELYDQENSQLLDRISIN